MSVQQQTPYNNYVANGSTTVFPYTFLLLNADDLIVMVDGVVQGSGYTITDISSSAGGSVIFDNPPANGLLVSLNRILRIERLTDYQDNGDFLADTVNNDFDRIWMVLQQMYGGGITATIQPATLQEMRAGSEPGIRLMSPELIKEAIYSLSSGGIGTTTRIVVISDSTATQNPLTDESWPEIMERVINNSGGRCEVINLSYGGNHAYLANTQLQYGGTLTCVTKAIALDPDIVIVALGYNGGLNDMGRSVAQVQADTASLFTTLRGGLPDAKLVYASQLPYDKANFTTALLKNKGVIPYYFTLKTGTILSGMYCSEMLDDDASASVKTLYGNWELVDSYTKGLATLDGYCTLDYWKLFRMGMGGRDGMHLFQFANFCLAAYALKGLRARSWFSTLFPGFVADPNSAASDPDLLFSTMMSASGNGWTWNNTFPAAPNNMNHQWGGFMAYYPDSWYLPSKGKFTLDANFPGYSYNPSFWEIKEGPPASSVYYSIDGAAFADTGVDTNNEGYCVKATVGRTPLLTVGAHTMRFNIGNEVYGPFSVTANSPSVPTVAARRTTALALSNNVLTTLIFDTEDIDTANAYNNATGIFTCPAQGIYLVSAQARLSSAYYGQIYAFGIAKNGVSGSERICEDTGLSPYNNGSYGEFAVKCSRLVSLNVGDTIAVHVLFAYSSCSVSPGAASYSGATMLNIARIGD